MRRIIVLVLISFFYIGIRGAWAAPIGILSNSNHYYSEIGTAIDKLLGSSYTSSQFTIDYTDYTIASTDTCSSSNTIFAGYDPTVAVGTTSGFLYCNSSDATTSPQFPFQIFTTSFTGYSGDSVPKYNTFSDYNITDNYAFTNELTSGDIQEPPTLYTAPGGVAFGSGAGVEWTLDQPVYCGTDATLSCLTAANAGVMGWLLYEHPTWNLFDVKAAMRQSGTNWATGYSPSTYGFGVVTATTTNMLTDSQILLQPPEAAATTIQNTLGMQITFTVFPFRQTRRVKDVLFEFATTTPGFEENELTLSQIQDLGGEKVMQYIGTTATSTLTPIYMPVNNAHFVWFTADNSTDNLAHFSRIDTYNVLGPISQEGISFASAPANNAISTTTSPTFTWEDANGDIGVSKYELYVDGTLNKDNIFGTSTTPASPLSVGSHTWYVEAVNGGVTATTTTRTINIIPGYVPGHTFYVDNVLGSDNNPGSQALPWATLTKAGEAVQPGDSVVIVKNVNDPYRETLSPVYSGTASDPITFEGIDAAHKPEIWGSNDVSWGSNNGSGDWSVYSGTIYQKPVATQPNIVAVGPSIGSLTMRTAASSTAALTPGTWFWSSGTLYYELANGEDITSLHIEAGARSYGISSTYTSGIVYKNIIVRYANKIGVNLGGSTAQNLGVYDSDTGIGVSAGSAVNYCVAADNLSNGILNYYQNNVSITHTLMYGNGGDGLNINLYGGEASTVQNDISAGNAGYPFDLSTVIFGFSVNASHNSWDVANDPEWATYSGTDNQALLDPLFVSTSTDDFSLQTFSPDIDSGTSLTGFATDFLGNPIYGTPDIGAYEYQPPYTITSGSVPVGGSFRVYGNGNYRMLTATSSSVTAHLTIAPPGGFSSTNYDQWLDVTVNTWNTSGNYAKSWTATSSQATSIVQTIGDLASSSWYTVSVDGVASMTLESDANGNLTYTYAGGWSTAHTFTVNQAVNGAAPLTLSAPSDDATESVSAPLSWNWNVSDGSGVAKYQLYVDNSLAIDAIVPTATSVSIPRTISCNELHSWYIQAVDGSGNAADSGTRHFTIPCGGISVVAEYPLSNPVASPVLTGTSTALLKTNTTEPTASSSPASSVSALTNIQIQSILSLLSSFGADAGTLAKVDAALTGTSAPRVNVSIAQPCSFARNLTIGKKGDDVTCLQQALIKDGYRIAAGATGYFGSETRTAVSLWQKAHDVIPAYGYFGPLSRERWAKE